jgi:hypothetical protein
MWKQISIIEAPNGAIQMYCNGVPTKEIDFWIDDKRIEANGCDDNGNPIKYDLK